MRSLGISEVENFPFPTAPPQASLERALNLLVNLGAISPPKRVQSLTLQELAIGTELYNLLFIYLLFLHYYFLLFFLLFSILTFDLILYFVKKPLKSF